MTTAPVITFAVITKDRVPVLLETIGHIARTQTLPYEIVIVDNGSREDAGPAVAEASDRARFIRLGANTGIGAWNVCFAEARGRYVAIMDDDAYPAYDLALSMREFEKDSSLGLIACNIMNDVSGRSEFSDEFQKAERRDTHYFIGCGAVVRKDVLDRAGYYDERFFLYYNDNDLAARIIKSGYKVRFYRDQVFIHKGTQVLERRGERFYYEFRNLLWYLVKNFPAPYAIKRIFRELRITYAKASRRGDGPYFRKAVIDTVKNLPYLISRRKPFTREELRLVLGKAA